MEYLYLAWAWATSTNGLLVLGAAAVALEKIAPGRPWLSRGLNAALDYLGSFRKNAPANPPADVVPVAAPSPSGIDAAVKLLADAAARKYPTMTADEALKRFAVEQAHYAYFSTPDPAPVEPAPSS